MMVSSHPVLGPLSASTLRAGANRKALSVPPDTMIWQWYHDDSCLSQTLAVQGAEAEAQDCYRLGVA